MENKIFHVIRLLGCGRYENSTPLEVDYDYVFILSKMSYFRKKKTSELTNIKTRHSC